MATNPLLYPALVETALITYRGVINKSNVNNPIPHFPLPSQIGRFLFTELCRYSLIQQIA